MSAPPRHRHHVCGLVLESPFPLPLPLAPPGPADVCLVRAPVPEIPQSELTIPGVAAPADPRVEPPADPAPLRTPEGDVVVGWRGLGAFRVGSRRVAFEPVDDAAPEALAAQILGPVLAVLLHLRGVLPLHGSSVATPAGAAAFLGVSGAGKSTLAAALVRRGGRLLADDLTAVVSGAATASGNGTAGDATSRNRPSVLPAGAELRLWPDAAAALGWAAPGASEKAGRGKAVFPLDASSDRFRIAAESSPESSGTTSTAPSAVPLASVWVLESGSEPGIEALSPRRATAELLRHAWTSRLVGAEGAPAAEAAAHLERCAAVAAAVPVRRVAVGPLATLPELAAWLAAAIALD